MSDYCAAAQLHAGVSGCRDSQASPSNSHNSRKQKVKKDGPSDPNTQPIKCLKTHVKYYREQQLIRFLALIIKSCHCFSCQNETIINVTNTYMQVHTYTHVHKTQVECVCVCVHERVHKLMLNASAQVQICINTACCTQSELCKYKA